MCDVIAASMLVGLAFGRIGCLLNGCCYGGESTAPWAVTFPRESGPETVSPPYSDQAAAGRFYGFRVASSSSEKHNGKPATVVERVDAGSPAEQAGLRVGDALSRINGQSIGGVEGARMLIHDAFMSGRSLELAMAGGDVKTIPAVEPPLRSKPVHPTQIYSAVTAALLAWVLWSYYPFRRRDGEVTALMFTLYPIARFLLEMIRVDEPSVFGTGLSISQNLSVLLLLVAGGFWLWLLRQPVGRLAFRAAPAESR
jgi:phosphatidylglycerol---prolipoprotein diacylglyceryl transferase